MGRSSNIVYESYFSGIAAGFKQLSNGFSGERIYEIGSNFCEGRQDETPGGETWMRNGQSRPSNDLISVKDDVYIKRTGTFAGVAPAKIFDLDIEAGVE